jgi:hypothetical protein
MAYQGVQNPISGLKANADLSSYQHRFIKFTSGKVTYCATQGEQAYGVLQDKPAAANRSCNVDAMGGNISKVEAGAAVSQGDTVMTDTVGRAITWTTKNAKLGYALTAAAAAGEKIEVLLFPLGPDVSTAKGTIPLDICALREVVSNDIGDSVADESGAGTAQGGGYLTNQTTPLLQRVNAATDKALRVAWAASDSTEVQFPPVMLPQDFDSGTDFTVHLYAGMAGATDTPTIDVQAFNLIGDTEMGGATGALSDTAGEVSATIANASVAAAPGFLNIALVPGAHTTDILWIYGAWIEYTRKVN